MSDSFELRNPDNFVAGVVGEPGERIFFLQASEENLVVTMKVEKGQVQSLASYLADVLDDQSKNLQQVQSQIWLSPQTPFGLLVHSQLLSKKTLRH